jgi:hypothetical protein
MAEPPTPESIAAELTAPQRALIKCLGSGTDWRKARVKPATVQLAVLKGLVERDHTSQLVLTGRGRGVLRELLGER